MREVFNKNWNAGIFKDNSGEKKNILRGDSISTVALHENLVLNDYSRRGVVRINKYKISLQILIKKDKFISI